MSSEKLNSEREIKKILLRLRNELSQNKIEHKIEKNYSDYNTLFNDLYLLAESIKLLAESVKISNIVEKIVALMKHCNKILGSSPDRLSIIESIENNLPKTVKKLSDDDVLLQFLKTQASIDHIIAKNENKYIFITCYAINENIETLEPHLAQAMKIPDIKLGLQKISKNIPNDLELDIKELIAEWNEEQLQKALKWVEKILVKKNIVAQLHGDLIVEELVKQKLRIESLLKIKKIIEMQFTFETVIDDKIFDSLECFKNIGFGFWRHNFNLVTHYFQTIRELLWITNKKSDTASHHKINLIYLSSLQRYEYFCSIIKSDSDDKSIEMLMLYLAIAGSKAYIALSPELKKAVYDLNIKNKAKYDEKESYYYDLYFSTLNFLEEFEKLPIAEKTQKLDILSKKVIALLEKDANQENNCSIEFFIIDGLLELLDLSLMKMGAFSFGQLPGFNHVHYLMNVFQLSSLIHQAIDENDSQLIIDFFDENSDLDYGNTHLCIPLLLSYCSKHLRSTENANKMIQLIAKKLFDRLLLDKSYLIAIVNDEVSNQVYLEVSHVLSILLQNDNFNQINNMFGVQIANEIVLQMELVKELQAIKSFLFLEPTHEKNEKSQVILLENFKNINFGIFISNPYIAYQCYLKFEEILTERNKNNTPEIKDQVRKNYAVFQDGLLQSFENAKLNSGALHDPYLAFMFLFIKGPQVAHPDLMKVLTYFKKSFDFPTEFQSDFAVFIDIYLSILDYFLNDKEYLTQMKMEKLNNILDKMDLVTSKKILQNKPEGFLQGITLLLDYIASEKSLPLFSSASSASSASSRDIANPFEQLNILCQQEKQKITTILMLEDYSEKLKKNESEMRDHEQNIRKNEEEIKSIGEKAQQTVKEIAEIESTIQQNEANIKLLEEKLKSQENEIQQNETKLINNEAEAKQSEKERSSLAQQLRSLQQALESNETEIKKFKEKIDQSEEKMQQHENSMQKKEEQFNKNKEEKAKEITHKTSNILQKIRQNEEKVKQHAEFFSELEQRMRRKVIEEKNLENSDLAMTHALVYFRNSKISSGQRVLDCEETYRNSVKRLFHYILIQTPDSDINKPEDWILFIKKIYPEDREWAMRCKQDLIFVIGEYHEKNKHYEKALKFYEYYKFSVFDVSTTHNWPNGLYKIESAVIHERLQFCRKQIPNPAEVPSTLSHQQAQRINVTLSAQNKITESKSGMNQ